MSRELLVSAHEAWKSTNPSDQLVGCHTTTGIDDILGRAAPELISTADHNVELVARLLLSCRQEGVAPVAFAIPPLDIFHPSTVRRWLPSGLPGEKRASVEQWFS